MTKRLELTNGNFALVDEEDYEWLKGQFNKFSDRKGYVVMMKKVGGKMRQFKLHEVIMNRYQTVPRYFIIRFRDSNHLNNTRDNLYTVVYDGEFNGGGRKRKYFCSKGCGRFRYKSLSTCLPCHNEYQRKKRKKDPEQTKRETEYKRTYRANLKKGLVIRREK